MATNPGVENQGAENRAKPRITNNRDSQTDTRSFAATAFYVDMSPSTLLDEMKNDGYFRTSRPTGAKPAQGDNTTGTGGRALTDTEAASRLGIKANKN